MDRKKVSIPQLKDMKQVGEKISMLTAYDYPTAKLIDEAGIEMVLVGDSLGMVVLGYDSTVPVTMEEMIHHSKAVRRGIKYAFLVGDMPFLSYQISPEEAVRNAGRFVKEAGCDAVKLEGGAEVIDKAEAIINAGMPVVGHLGLTPQSATQLGGLKVQGKDAESAKRILDGAQALDAAGVFSIILECVPADLAKKVTESVSVPTIGIGAGIHCDGQVLVTHDLIGLYDKFIPKFVKQYTKIAGSIKKAIEDYRDEVRQQKFPGEEHTFGGKK